MLTLVLLEAAACAPWPWNQTTDAGPDVQPTGCRLGFAGDPNGTPRMELTSLTENYLPVPVVEGGGIPMMFPPQGGRVIFVGVRAFNMDPCQVHLSGALRDPVTQQVRLDARTVNLRVSDGGSAVSVDTNITTYANIPVCPNQWSAADLFGSPFTLEMALTDRAGHTLSQSLTVVPYCAEPANEADCRCICRGGYMLGQSCMMPDAGPLDGGGG